ncbi:MAG: hypothetical protein CVT97_08940 [Bacteroidetes bacterium HGW-Bacteroidetes-14]|nr:MAG: hypothetical protein CVT97_08940 [Bacteroidetes bacterium HGW-Bacteroidetes-14]
MSEVRGQKSDGGRLSREREAITREGGCQRSEVRGQKSDVGGRLSREREAITREVGGRWTEVGGQRSVDRGRRPEVGGQRSVVGRRSGGQRAENKTFQVFLLPTWKV